MGSNPIALTMTYSKYQVTLWINRDDISKVRIYNTPVYEVNEGMAKIAAEDWVKHKIKSMYTDGAMSFPCRPDDNNEASEIFVILSHQIRDCEFSIRLSE